MKAIIIEDETAALSSLKAVLQQNSVVEIEVIAELESIEDSVEWFQCSLQPDLIFIQCVVYFGRRRREPQPRERPGQLRCGVRVAAAVEPVRRQRHVRPHRPSAASAAGPAP